MIQPKRMSDLWALKSAYCESYIWTSRNEDTLSHKNPMENPKVIAKSDKKTFPPELLIEEVSPVAAGVVFSSGGARVELDGVSLIRGSHEASALSLRLVGPGAYPIH